MQWAWCVFMLVVGGQMGVVRGFSRGPPLSACEDMFPQGHAVDAQASPAPFEITVSPTQFGPGDTLTVTIRRTDGAQFLGFFIQARADLAPDTRIGTLSVGDSATQSLVTCPDADGVSHTTSDGSVPLKTEAVVTWTAPSTASNVFFRATVVQQQDTFWTGVESDVIVDESADQNVTRAPSTTPAQFAGSLDLSGCGSSKGCYLDPEDCSDDCDRAVTWTPIAEGETNILFELYGKTDGWLGIGFSRDQEMGSDYVLMCLRDGDVAVVQQSYNEGRSNSAFRNHAFGISAAQVSYEDGFVTCVFRRELDASTVDGDESDFIDLDRKYTLLLGEGPASSRSPRQHSDIPLISDKSVNAARDAVLVGSDPIDYLIYKLHGIFMIAAWMFLISMSLLLARFYKPALPEKKICGVAIWFALHRFLNVVAVALTIAAFVMIFVEVEDFTEIGDDAEDDYLKSEHMKAHPILGIIVTALAIINPLMTLCRPHPDEPRRPIFNWAHWGVGTAAHLISFVTIFFGFSMPKAQPFIDDADRGWVRWVFVAFLAWHAAFYLLLDALKCVRDRNKKEDKIKHELELQAPGYKSTDHSESSEMLYKASEQQSMRVQYGALLVYAMGWLAAFVAIVYGIASADTD